MRWALMMSRSTLASAVGLPLVPTPLAVPARPGERRPRLSAVPPALDAPGTGRQARERPSWTERVQPLVSPDVKDPVHHRRR